MIDPIIELELDKLKKRISDLEEKVEELSDPERLRRILLDFGVIGPSAEDE